MRLTKYLSDGSAVVCCNRAFVDVSYVGEPDGVYFGSIIDKLAAYEDAEDQGRMVILPCAVEDAVYYINPDAIGKTVFFTREEAEAAMKGEKTCDR